MKHLLIVLFSLANITCFGQKVSSAIFPHSEPLDPPRIIGYQEMLGYKFKIALPDTSYPRIVDFPACRDSIPAYYELIRIIDDDYDTVKIIAEVYFLSRGFQFLTPSARAGRFIYDTVFNWQESNIVETKKVLAWEIWRFKWKEFPVKGPFETGPSIYWGEENYYWTRVPVERVKRLSYNRKDELHNVLQSWILEEKK